MLKELFQKDPITQKRDTISILLLLGTLVYVVSIIWINFHAEQWYSFDIYSDVLVSRFMVEKKSLFPDNWVFGNQYYVIATPVLAALFYAFLHDTVLSMALASNVMTVLILMSYLWAIRPFADRKCGLAGLFALSGAVVLGNSAAYYLHGMEYYYTMASFYACYVITIFITLGIYFRLYYKKAVSPIMILLSGLMSVALGVQSLRGMLVLYLPLLAIALLLFLFGKDRKSHIPVYLYTLYVLIFDIVGIIIIKFIPVRIAPIIGDVSLTLHLPELIQNFKATASEFCIFTGLKFYSYGWKWLPLFGIAVFLTAVVIYTLIKVIKNWSDSMIEWTILFLFISVLAVFAVGVLLFRVRTVYFFTWHLLVVFCFVYIAKEHSMFSKPIIILLLLAGLGNYGTNFIPDFTSYAGRNAFFQNVTNELVAEGIDCLYYANRVQPIFPAYSNDKIVSAPAELDPTEKSGGVMCPVTFLQPLDLYRNAHQYNAYIVFSNETFDYLEEHATDEYVEKLMANLTLARTDSYLEEEYTFYRFSPELLNYKEPDQIQ